MKKSVILLFCLIIWTSQAGAQKLISVYNLTGVEQFDSADSAIAHAASGDQVFFPGGIFNVGNLVIDKSLMIFGAGHYHDSTLATGETFLNGNVILSNGASAGLLTGFDISGDIAIAASGSDSVSNFTISRCSFDNLLLSSTGLPPTNARNFSVYENVIKGNVNGAMAIGLNCSKNFIEGQVNYIQSGVFTNNDFLGLGNCTTLVKMMTNVKASNFDNNIFLYSPPACTGAAFFDTSCTNNGFMNNLFLMNLSFPQGANSGFNNMVNQPLNTIFTNATGNQFQYNQDYHLKTGSPGIYGGTDSYDVGVYGSPTPYKESSVPFNPHIQQKSIGQTTNPQGLINIQIRVAAQDH